jgi:hypothetical protein
MRQSMIPIISARRFDCAGQPHLPAGLVGRLEHHDRMPPLCRHPRRLQPRRTGADDDHLLLHPRRGDVMRLGLSRPVEGLWMQSAMPP